MDLSSLIDLLPAKYAGIALALVGLCAAVAAVLPPPKGSGIYATIYRVLNLIGANFGHARNASAPPSALSGPTKPVLVALLACGLAGLAGCSQASVDHALASSPGQLFCAIQTGGGGALVVRLIDAEASALVPAAEPVAVIATGASKAYVDAACARAAANVGAAVGVPVSPPANPATAPAVAVTPPAAS